VGYLSAKKKSGSIKTSQKKESKEKEELPPASDEVLDFEPFDLDLEIVEDKTVYPTVEEITKGEDLTKELIKKEEEKKEKKEIKIINIGDLMKVFKIFVDANKKDLQTGISLDEKIEVVGEMSGEMIEIGIEKTELVAPGWTGLLLLAAMSGITLAPRDVKQMASILMEGDDEPDK